MKEFFFRFSYKEAISEQNFTNGYMCPLWKEDIFDNIVKEFNFCNKNAILKILFDLIIILDSNSKAPYRAECENKIVKYFVF